MEKQRGLEAFHRSRLQVHPDGGFGQFGLQWLEICFPRLDSKIMIEDFIRPFRENALAILFCAKSNDVEAAADINYVKIFLRFPVSVQSRLEREKTD